MYDYINVPQTTNNLVLTLANPTLTTTPRKVTIVNTSTATTTTLNGVGFVGRLIFEWNGTAWSYIGGAEGDHVLVRQTGVEATNTTAGHHVAYTVATTSSGSTIVADLTTAYSTSTNAASRGRFTLQPGHTYLLRGVLGLTTNNGVQWAWFNSDTNTQIGTTTQGFSASQSTVEASIAVVTTPIRVELRMVTSVGSYNVGNWENHAFIQCLK